MKRSKGSKNVTKSTGKKRKANDVQWPQVKTKRSSKKKQTDKSTIDNNK